MDVRVTTKGQRTRIPKADMLFKNFHKEKLVPLKDNKLNGKWRNRFTKM